MPLDMPLEEIRRQHIQHMVQQAGQIQQEQEAQQELQLGQMLQEEQNLQQNMQQELPPIVQGMEVQAEIEHMPLAPVQRRESRSQRKKRTELERVRAAAGQQQENVR